MFRLLISCLLLGTISLQAAAPLDALVRVMDESGDPALELNVLKGMNAALKGKRDLPAPAGWELLYPKLRASGDEAVRQQAQILAVTFGGESAFAELRAVAADAKTQPEARQTAVESLVNARDSKTLPILLGLMREQGTLRRAALRGLALYDDPAIAPAILGAYGSLSGDEKRDALAALARRPASARALLAAVDAGTVSRADLTAPFARQLQDLNDPAIGGWLKEHWGAVRTSPADKLAEMAKLKAFLTPPVMAQADVNHGRAIFAQTCSICHTVFGTGAKIGPELPGAFEDIDYLLQNIVDPNAIIGKDYQQTVVQMKKGETVIGIVGAQDSSSLTLKTLGGAVTVQRADIAQLTVLDVSLMPEGLLTALPKTDVRDLFGYLRLHGQVPALVSTANLNDFNDDPGFERWSRSSRTAWKVENGVLTGHGSADRAEFITSDFVSDNYRLEMDVELTGADAIAEVAISGREPLHLAPREGLAAEFQLHFLAGQRWHLIIDESPAEVFGEAVRLTGGSERVTLSCKDKATGPRTPFTFRITGAQSGIEIRNLRLSLPDPKAD